MNSIFEITEATNEISYDESFNMALSCSRLILSDKEEDLILARKIIIRMLSVLQKLPKETYDIWGDLVEAVGFYPYLEKNKEIFQQKSLSDEIRMQSYKSDYLDGKYMHF